MKKNDRYFGLHFDFHAKAKQKHIGRYFDPSLYHRLLQEAKIDFMQCDTKGHEGFSSYPTIKGTPAPEIEKDILKEIRSITLEYGVDLYAHHSGAWDCEATQMHPEWAVRKEDGSVSQICSCFSPYYKERLVPQICEIAKYGLDGVWIDGECWAMIPDYSDYAKDAYQKRFNAELPRKNDADYPQFLEFIRQGFRDYVKNYVKEVKKEFKNFQITSNWYHTSFVPEKYDGTLDFISGDYEPNDSVNAARYEGRIIAPMGADWDLMSWAFTPQNGVLSRKSAVQLKQEAAACIALGGGVQLYNIQYDGSIQDFMIPVCAEVADFVQQRKAYCYRAKLIPQICVFYSAEAYYENTEMVFSRWVNNDLKEMKGTLLSILDSGFSAEIAITDNLYGNCIRYPMIVIPNFKIIETKIRKELYNYAMGGGNLILAGPDITLVFAEELGLSNCNTIDSQPIYLETGSGLDGINTRFMKTDNSDYVFKIYDKNIKNESANSYPAILSKNIGKGKMYAILFEAGRQYLDHPVPAIKEIMKSVIMEMFQPAISLVHDKPLDIVLATLNGKTIIQVTNMSGGHSNSKLRYIEDIQPVKDIEIIYRNQGKVVKILRMPENEELNFEITNDGVIIHINELYIHSSIVLEQE